MIIKIETNLRIIYHNFVSVSDNKVVIVCHYLIDKFRQRWH